MTPTSCSTREIVQITKRSASTLRELVRQHNMPCKSTGQGSKIRWNPSVVVPWLIEFYTAKYNPEVGSKSLAAERLRLISEQADREASDNARKRAEVIDYEVAEGVITRLASLTVSRLDGLGGRLANELVNEPNPAVIKDKILSECRAIREALADSAKALGRHYQDIKKASAEPA